MKYRSNQKIIRDLFTDCDEIARDDVLFTMRNIMGGVVTRARNCELVAQQIAQQIDVHNLDCDLRAIMQRKNFDSERETLSKLLKLARKLTKIVDGGGRHVEREAFEYCEQYVEIYKDED